MPGSCQISNRDALLQSAARLMLDTSTAGPTDIRDLARWGLFNPEQAVWGEYDFIATATKP